jgi:cytochrome c oxidase subunit 3
MSDLTLKNGALPVGSVGVRSSGWWGMFFFIVSESSVFAYLCFSYYYFNVQREYSPWPPYGWPSFIYSVPETALLFIATALVWYADRRASAKMDWLIAAMLFVAALFGSGFIGLGLQDWRVKPYTLPSTPYASLYLVITGVHLAHVLIGVLMTLAVLAWVVLGYFGPVRHVPIGVTLLYWYFLSATWFMVFWTLYLTPHMGWADP